MKNKEFDIIGHSLGINTYHAKLSKYKKDKELPCDFYRNYYCAGKKGGVFVELESLAADGYMDKWEKFDNIYFSVTDKGILEFRKQFKIKITDTFKPPSIGKQKYLDYLHDDGEYSFAEFLGIVKPKMEVNYYGIGTRFVSVKYPEVKGEFKDTIKEAKESYKLSLKKYLLNGK